MEIVKLLEQNKLQNTPMLDLLKREHEIIEMYPSGATLYDPTSETYFVSCENEKEMTTNIFTKGRGAIIAFRENTISRCSVLSSFTIVKPCVQVVHIAKNLIPVPSKSIEMRHLIPSDVEIVCRHYSLGLGEKYILNRIENKELFGAYLNGELAGFAGRHDEGAIGMLEVLPTFRRCGVGSELVRFMTDYTLKLGFTPYGHIMQGNKVSEALMSSVGGFVACPEMIGWMFAV